MASRPLFSRRRDLIYLTFFIIHVPVMCMVDFAPFYPSSIRPSWSYDLIKWYVLNYLDKFFTSPPAWFKLYVLLEFLYHVPLSIWAVGALIRDDPRVPLQLLIFATQTGVTTATCVADMLSWAQVSNSAKVQLCYLYVPYLALSIFMGLDMYIRLSEVLKAHSRAKKD